MKTWSLPALVISGFVFQLSKALAAEPAAWAGEYADKKFLNGSATFQLSIEHAGGRIQVSFDAVNNNGQGCAPEAQAIANASGKDKLQFTFRDNQGNAGSGEVVRSGEELVLSLKPTRTVKQDCVRFYRDNIRLKRVR